ncbi:hypothetical protein ACU4GR_26565 [Methylobacterium oryzae CBMB20]
MKRFFGVPADGVDLEFAEKRMLWIKEHARPRVLLRYVRRHRATGPTNRQLARPRAGFTALYEVAAGTLRQRGTVFHLGQKIASITRRGTRFEVLTDRSRVTARRLISTIPINRALELCGIREDPRLPSVTLISLYFSFSGHRGFDCSILYNFAHDGAWKRLTMYSDFYGHVDGREYFGVEVIAAHAGNCVSTAEQDFRAHVAKNRLFVGDLICEGSQVVPCAYPIYTGAGPSEGVPRALASARLRDRVVRPAGRLRLPADGPCFDAQRGGSLDADGERQGLASILRAPALSWSGAVPWPVIASAVPCAASRSPTMVARRGDRCPPGPASIRVTRTCAPSHWTK